jgi:hypothetical protein
MALISLGEWIDRFEIDGGAVAPLAIVAPAPIHVRPRAPSAAIARLAPPTFWGLARFATLRRHRSRKS